ncbi:MAG TPA: hypothetical protein VFQ44_08500 [Streptosporangiaceae bacterium]|nr:hypothetical protein [Streptosporangiaceae bacterium]
MTSRFERDWKQLGPDLRARFQRVVTGQFVPDLTRGVFRPGLRVKGVQAAAGVFEMTWAPDGRATFSYGTPQQPGEPHIIWRRIGTHDVFREP